MPLLSGTLPAGAALKSKKPNRGVGPLDDWAQAVAGSKALDRYSGSLRKVIFVVFNVGYRHSGSVPIQLSLLIHSPNYMDDYLDLDLTAPAIHNDITCAKANTCTSPAFRAEHDGLFSVV